MPEARILICANDWTAAADTRRSLRSMDYPVSTVTGQEALKAAVTLKPDLLIVEINLKGGLDVIQAAARIGPYLDIPVVYVTVGFDARVFAQAKASRPSGWLVKPFSASQLQATIEAALNNPPPAGAQTAAEHLSERDHRELQKGGSWLGSQAEAIIPMCSCCKQVRHSEGAWTPPETYFAERFGIRFTHSLCPACLKSFRPDR